MKFRANRKLGSRKVNPIVTIVSALVIVSILLAVVYAIGRNAEQGTQEVRGQMSEGFGQIPTVNYDGNVYARKMNQTLMLLMGVDKQSDAQTTGFRQGGQSDFLLLLIIDHDDKIIKRLQIDRDTMTQVATLGILGNVVGTSYLQICLSHGFGATAEACCENTALAVQNLLQGIPVDLYLALDLNSIGVLNDLLGGVTVTLEDDFTAFDQTMRMGDTVQLAGDQAELFVRYRMQVGDGTNVSRMRRQRTFMSAAYDAIKGKYDENAAFFGTLYDGLSGIMTTNISRGRVINEANRAYHYTVQDVQTLKGEHAMSESGFVEFHADEAFTLSWIMDTFFALKP